MAKNAPRLTEARVHEILDEFYALNGRVAEIKEIITFNGGGSATPATKYRKSWPEPETPKPQEQNALELALKVVIRQKDEIGDLQQRNTKLERDNARLESLVSSKKD